MFAELSFCLPFAGLAGAVRCLDRYQVGLTPVDMNEMAQVTAA